MSASNLILTLLILQIIFLLEPIVLLLCLWLLAYSLITGTPLETLLRDITVVEDDILLPHPPGFINASDSAYFQGDTSTYMADSDISDTSSLDDDFLSSASIDLEMSCPSPAFTFDSKSTIYMLVAPEHKFDLEPAVDSWNRTVDVILECSSSNKVHLPDISQPPPSVKISNISEQESTTSGSQSTSMHHTERIVVEASPATSYTHRRNSEYAQSIDIPAELDERPVFSRHSMTGDVIFPIRKPPAVEQAPSNPFDINSMLKRMPPSWAQKPRRDMPRSLRIAMSGVLDSRVFKKEQKSVVAGCDVYDSWPYIRTEIEQEIENEREKDEEDTFVSALKWAVSTLRV